MSSEVAVNAVNGGMRASDAGIGGEKLVESLVVKLVEAWCQQLVEAWVEKLVAKRRPTAP